MCWATCFFYYAVTAELPNWFGDSSWPDCLLILLVAVTSCHYWQELCLLSCCRNTWGLKLVGVTRLPVGKSETVLYWTAQLSLCAHSVAWCKGYRIILMRDFILTWGAFTVLKRNSGAVHLCKSWWWMQLCSNIVKFVHINHWSGCWYKVGFLVHISELGLKYYYMNDIMSLICGGSLLYIEFRDIFM